MTKPVLRITWVHLLLGVAAWVLASICGFAGYLLVRFA